MKTKKSYMTLGMVFLLLLMMGILTGKVSVKAEAVDWLIPEKCSLTVMDSEEMCCGSAGEMPEETCCGSAGMMPEEGPEAD